MTLKSAPSIGGVAVVAQEQRQVIVPLAIAAEGDGDFGIDAGAAVALKISAGFEVESIDAWGNLLRKIGTATVGIGRA